MLTRRYDQQFRQWLTGSLVDEPLPLSSDSLYTLLSTDLNKINGLEDINSRILHYIDILYNQNEDDFVEKTGIKLSTLKKTDIQRSQIVSNIINLYDRTN